MKLDISAVSGECSQAWKALPPEHRKYWDDVSEQDKREYFKRKESYQGPWRIATSKVKRKVRIDESNAAFNHLSGA